MRKTHKTDLLVAKKRATVPPCHTCEKEKNNVSSMYLCISMLLFIFWIGVFAFFLFCVWHGVARKFDFSGVWHAKTECATHSILTQQFNIQYFSLLVLSVARWHGGTEKHTNLKRFCFFSKNGVKNCPKLVQNNLNA